MAAPPAFSSIQFTTIGKPPALLARIQKLGDPSHFPSPSPSWTPDSEQHGREIDEVVLSLSSSSKPSLLDRISSSIPDGGRDAFLWPEGPSDLILPTPCQPQDTSYNISAPLNATELPATDLSRTSERSSNQYILPTPPVSTSASSMDISSVEADAEEEAGVAPLPASSTAPFQEQVPSEPRPKASTLSSPDSLTAASDLHSHKCPNPTPDTGPLDPLLKLLSEELCAWEDVRSSKEEERHRENIAMWHEQQRSQVVHQPFLTHCEEHSRLSSKKLPEVEEQAVDQRLAASSPERHCTFPGSARDKVQSALNMEVIKSEVFAIGVERRRSQGPLTQPREGVSTSVRTDAHEDALSPENAGGPDMHADVSSLPVTSQSEVKTSGNLCERLSDGSTPMHTLTSSNNAEDVPRNIHLPPLSPKSPVSSTETLTEGPSLKRMRSPSMVDESEDLENDMPSPDTQRKKRVKEELCVAESRIGVTNEPIANPLLLSTPSHAGSGPGIEMEDRGPSFGNVTVERLVERFDDFEMSMVELSNERTAIGQDAQQISQAMPFPESMTNTRRMHTSVVTSSDEIPDDLEAETSDAEIYNSVNVGPPHPTPLRPQPLLDSHHLDNSSCSRSVPGYERSPSVIFRHDGTYLSDDCRGQRRSTKSRAAVKISELEGVYLKAAASGQSRVDGSNLSSRTSVYDGEDDILMTDEKASLPQQRPRSPSLSSNDSVASNSPDYRKDEILSRPSQRERGKDAPENPHLSTSQSEEPRRLSTGDNFAPGFPHDACHPASSEEDSRTATPSSPSRGPPALIRTNSQGAEENFGSDLEVEPSLSHRIFSMASTRNSSPDRQTAVTVSKSPVVRGNITVTNYGPRAATTEIGQHCISQIARLQGKLSQQLLKPSREFRGREDTRAEGSLLSRLREADEPRVMETASVSRDLLGRITQNVDTNILHREEYFDSAQGSTRHSLLSRIKVNEDEPRHRPPMRQKDNAISSARSKTITKPSSTRTAQSSHLSSATRVDGLHYADFDAPAHSSFQSRSHIRPADEGRTVSNEKPDLAARMGMDSKKASQTVPRFPRATGQQPYATHPYEEPLSSRSVGRVVRSPARGRGKESPRAPADRGRHYQPVKAGVARGFGKRIHDHEHVTLEDRMS